MPTLDYQSPSTGGPRMPTPFQGLMSCVPGAVAITTFEALQQTHVSRTQELIAGSVFWLSALVGVALAWFILIRYRDLRLRELSLQFARAFHIVVLAIGTPFFVSIAFVLLRQF